ncbi:hypothetical protein [Telluribacter humicola]|uniref:hypothetical protein n=1 Tax=Telluribacter humicola TaxID=1720261 RepID=UPI001A9714EE|nr:hypothetical protein [Telluribacter humicola]
MKVKTLYMLTLALLLMAAGAQAQMPHDVIYMPKNTSCLALTYGHSSWDEYWENTLKRENLNIGTHTTQMAMAMAAVGITDRLNVIASVPYIWTQTSAGNLMGLKGFQDASAWIKYKAFDKKGLSLHGVVGGSIPLTNYVPEFLPMSIGLQARTATGRIIANYSHSPTGLYLTGHGSYSWRSNIYVDRDSYLAGDRMHNTDEVQIPNAIDLGARVGILKSKWQTEVFVERFACVDGDNIRRNDMPFPTNKMEMTTVGWYGKVQPRNIGVNARVGYVVEGLNVGQSLSYSVGFLYQFNY